MVQSHQEIFPLVRLTWNMLEKIACPASKKGIKNSMCKYFRIFQDQGPCGRKDRTWFVFTSEFLPLTNKKRSLISGGTSKNVDIFMNHIFINQEYSGFVHGMRGRGNNIVFSSFLNIAYQILIM